VRRELAFLVSGALLLAGCSGGGRPAATSTAPTPSEASVGGTTAEPAAAPPGTLVGYRQVANPSGTQRTAGAVRVPLSSEDATRLADRIAALSKASGPRCVEPAVLIYKITFTRDQRRISGDTVSGYRCAAAVGIMRSGGKVTDWRRDANCQLFKEVRRLLPGSARGTRSATVGCA
jgi:hypothetical protein